jgi:crossover junction endodeoxyribonuclease RuvC
MSQPGGILALDLATRTGWAYGVPGGKPIGGVWELPPAALLGRKLASFENQLWDALALHQPRLVMFAASFTQGKAITGAELLLGLSAHVESSCYRHDAEVRKQAESTIRVHVFGKGGAQGSREALKARAMAWCAEQGYRVASDDHADALVVWTYACQTAGIRFGLARAA